MEVFRWFDDSRQQIVRCVASSGLRGIRSSNVLSRWRSGSRSPRDCSRRRLPPPSAWRRRSARAGSTTLAACHHSICAGSPRGRYLSFSEREEIALLKVQGNGVREIARTLGRNAGTISRELRRNAATRGGKPEYRASVAQWKADMAAKRSKVAKLVAHPRLRAYVEDRLSGRITGPDGVVISGPEPARFTGRGKPHRKDRAWPWAWSPEQISNRLKVDFPDDESMRISHEAVYQSLYIEGRGALKRELVWCLRTGRALRAPRERSRRKTWAHVTPETLISERPAEAKTVQSPAIGKATYSSASSGPRSAPSSNARPGSRSWCICHARRATGTKRHRRTGLRWPATARSR